MDENLILIHAKFLFQYYFDRTYTIAAVSYDPPGGSSDIFMDVVCKDYCMHYIAVDLCKSIPAAMRKTVKIFS